MQGCRREKEVREWEWKREEPLSWKGKENEVEPWTRNKSSSMTTIFSRIIFINILRIISENY